MIESPGWHDAQEVVKVAAPERCSVLNHQCQAPEIPQDPSRQCLVHLGRIAVLCFGCVQDSLIAKDVHQQECPDPNVAPVGVVRSVEEEPQNDVDTVCSGKDGQVARLSGLAGFFQSLGEKAEWNLIR